MKFKIKITGTLLLSYMLAILAFAIDRGASSGGQVFMFALPFVTTLALGRKYIDHKFEQPKK